VDLLALLRERRLLAIVRGGDARAALDTVLTLAHEGVTLIEVSLTTENALEVISAARTQLEPDAIIGAGTVITGQNANDARDAGASFAVTPGLCDGARAARDLDLPVLIGALTPTEVIAANQAGAAAVKLFPAATAGGPEYLRALRAPLPDIPFVPVGGVDAVSGWRYLDSGAVAIGVGSPLVGDAADTGDMTALRERIRVFTEEAIR
jgi:2-dehydro-3-deoxyphosphogluconate aldolase / (4S)-4-hydroxy-2-oxoglutarate aldolase